jgi:hypothetical protein
MDRSLIGGTVAGMMLALASLAFGLVTARADVVAGTQDPCPAGSVEEYAHHGAWCRPATCEDGCDGYVQGERQPFRGQTSASCGSRALCTQTVHYRGRSSGWSGAIDETYTVVLGPCRDGECVLEREPYESAAGYADPAGWSKDGNPACQTIEVCAPGQAPSEPTTPSEPSPAPPGETPPVAEAPNDVAPSTRCGCGLASRDAPIEQGALAIAAGAIALRYRRRR